MYFGAILMMLGPYIAFRSIILLIGTVISYIPLMKARIKLEEETLIGTFGDEYRNYIKRTKKLISFIY
jgi:protein-S-isoprenylcysteine O-methyltransferase Ste14